MNSKNSQIRAHARYLLDDNIFGKDWLKGALVHILIDVVTVLFSVALFSLTSMVIVPVLLAGAWVSQSTILINVIPAVLYFIDLIISCIIVGPVGVGTATVYIDLVRGEGRVKIGKFFYGFRNLLSNFLLGAMYILQVALWSLFFVIPGIYVAYSYALVFHVKRDNPNYNWKQCFDESERLMNGRRLKLFTLQISHIGWFIVGVAFVFIGTFWAEPYLHTSTAIFYEEAKASRGSK